MTTDLLDVAKTYLYQNFRPAPFVLDRGEGCRLFDTEGRSYLDMCAGIAVCTLGHAHPHYVKAISEQVGKLGHVSNYFYNDTNAILAKELCERTGMARAIFCNSGAEANEIFLKMARRHFYSKGDTKRFKLVAFERSFHGRTMGALAMTGQPKYREGFEPGVGGVIHVPYGDLDAVRAVMSDEVAAIVAEPVQGEGGVVPATPEFFQGLRKLADEFGALFMADEVQTGVGRTGRFLACEGLGVKADAVALAKGLGGGFPIGAVVCQDFLKGALPPGTHGSTYAGNALACRAALAVLEVIDSEDLMAKANARGEFLRGLLVDLQQQLPEKILAVRGCGLLQAAAMPEGVDGRGILAEIRKEGVFVTLAGGYNLRFCPPLIVTEAELTEAVAGVERALRRV